MWVYLISAALIFVGIAVGIGGGGIFTIVLVPLGLTGLAAAALAGVGGRKAQKQGGGASHESHLSGQPLPHETPQPSGRAPTSPEGLADARRAQQ
jgi:hypothetical protein